MKFYFVRHGKASQMAATDAERPLTPGGVESVKNMATVLHRAGIKPTKIYTSPRVRAVQTANLLAAALGQEAEVNDACNFHFNAKAALNLASGLMDDDEVMFVGHNPSMSEVVETITGASVELSTGAVACVIRVNSTSSQGAILKWLLTPKIVDAFFI
jgi:phosphohistidine phosphatase